MAYPHTAVIRGALRIVPGRWPVIVPVIGVAVLGAWNPADGGPTVCLFARCTGVACPGCGATRAVAALVRGDWSTSWSYHPLAGLLAVQAAVAWVWWMGVRTGRWRPPSPRLLNVTLGLTAGLLTAVWALRWVAGALPPV
jgi:hypothetical protein